MHDRLIELLHAIAGAFYDNDHVHGKNLLGQALMKVRDWIREQEPDWPNEFPVEYWALKESSNSDKNKEKISPTGRRREMEAEQLLGAWRGNAFEQIEEYKKSLERNLEEVEKKKKEGIREQEEIDEEFADRINSLRLEGKTVDVPTDAPRTGPTIWEALYGDK